MPHNPGLLPHNPKLSDNFWMEKALRLAKMAYNCGEVPIGAVVVDKNDREIGGGFNSCIQRHDPCAHAEIIAIRTACRSISNYRLNNARLYVTLYPCLMCLMAAVNARLSCIYFSAPSQKSWPLCSQMAKKQLWQLWDEMRETEEASKNLFGSLSIQPGPFRMESCNLLKQFFKDKRVKTP